MTSWIVTALAIVAFWLLLGFLGQRFVIYPTYAIPDLPRITPGDEAETFEIDTPAGPVDAWLLPGDRASADRPAPLLVFAHGNGERIEFWPDALGWYRRLGFSVLLVEFRGYGRSAGRPSERGIVRDFRVALDRVTARADIDSTRIVYHGRSLGGGVVASLARERPPAALVLQSTFRSLPAMAKRMLYPGFLMRDRYDTEGFLATWDGPVLVAHGRRDDVVPFEHAEVLVRRARRAELLAFDLGHNDFPSDSPRFRRAVESFLRSHGVLPPAEVETSGTGSAADEG